MNEIILGMFIAASTIGLIAFLKGFVEGWNMKDKCDKCEAEDTEANPLYSSFNGETLCKQCIPIGDFMESEDGEAIEQKKLTVVH